MSNDKVVIRFLDSIGINNYQDYDLSFEAFEKVESESQSWHFTFLKKSIWNASLLTTFLEATTNVEYKLNLSFNYAIEIKKEHVVSLFTGWFFNQTHLVFAGEFNLDGRGIDVVFKSKEDYDFNFFLISDFNNLLKTINYNFEISSSYEFKNEESENENLENQDNINVDDISEIEDVLVEPSLNSFNDEDEDVTEGTKLSEEIYLRNHQQIAEELKKQERFKKSPLSRDYREVKISEIDENSQAVMFIGRIYSISNRQIRKGYIYKFGVGEDFNGIKVTVFTGRSKTLTPDNLANYKIGMYVGVRGRVEIDKFDHGVIHVIATSFELTEGPAMREELYKGEMQRVELHAHTKMSTMDGIATVKDYAQLAKNMGHKAITITDHGGVQAYPDGYVIGNKLGLKVIYGIEMYMIDTKLHYIFNDSDVELNKASYVVFDFETTGLSSRYDRIIEFGAVKVENGMITKRIDLLINPGKDVVLTKKISDITNITSKMLYNKPTIEQVIDQILTFIGDSILVSHNAEFDYGFLKETIKRLNLPAIKNPVIDTLNLSRYMFPEARSHRLGNLARNMEVQYDEVAAHRADYDAEVLSNIWLSMLVKLTKDNKHLKHSQLGELTISDVSYRHLRPKHIVLLAKNDSGIKDIYKLVTLSNTTYLADVPKIPREIIMKHRENLLVGSACFEGEVFQTALNRAKDDLIDIIGFYDYIELQPPGNYSHLLNLGKISDKEMLYTFMKDIVEASEIANKIIVATGDAHYADPSDKIYRDVYISAKGVGGVNHPLMPYERDKFEHFENPDQHYKTTQEMLDEFSVEGLFSAQKAEEYVILNTNKILNMIGDAHPIKKGLFTPNIPHAATGLREVVYNTAHNLYGENLPEIIATRLEKELSGIIENGFSIIYYISYMLVKRANEEGFLVGSRGSVGSSLVATFAGITEVNPLPPHYLCPHCKHYEFETDREERSGFDFPPKVCPKCGQMMKSDGQNIPFETFLGFNAEKIPDIDLNFPGDYQARAHEYTKELLGAKNVFRAGTIETVAEKTAFGYVRGYFERNGHDLNNISNETIALIAAGCQNVKRTTGQHPGGIVVIPDNLEVEEFTPIQYPAENKDSTWLTTHLDYHSIDKNVLKLDILGHVDPLALKMNCDLAKMKVDEVPLGDKEALRLFSDNDVLKLKMNYLDETHGALGIPEFGTPFVRGLLLSAKPKTFNDLIIISGLSHGKGVWTGNADELIAKGVVNLGGVIGCRDDIMTYLQEKGVPGAIAFDTMESVRKGFKIPEKHIKVLSDNNVPQYFVESCNKITYLFPKAHASAYVIMAVRIAWFKVHRPLEYYATFFTVRSKQYDIKSMISGAEAMLNRLSDIRIAKKNRQSSPKDEEIEKTLQIAIEMVDRGYAFANVNLYKSHATDFLIDYENKLLIPPLNVIDGLGDNTAVTVIEARVNGEFLSIEDLLKRTKLNSQNIERMKDLGMLKGMSETNQMSLFDF